MSGALVIAGAILIHCSGMVYCLTRDDLDDFDTYAPLAMGFGLMIAGFMAWAYGA